MQMWGLQVVCLMGRRTERDHLRKTSRVGRGTMNAELCPDRGHHIPLEPHSSGQQSGGEGSPGQEGRGSTQHAQRLRVPRRPFGTSDFNRWLLAVECA